MTFIMLSILNLLSVFIMKECLMLSNVFSAYTEMAMTSLSFILLMRVMVILNLHMLNYLCVPGVNYSDYVK
jgi:hypothetical protein